MNIYDATEEVLRKVQTLRTSEPWGVLNLNRVVVGIFNYREEAKQFAKEVSLSSGATKTHLVIRAKGIILQRHR